MIVEIAMTPGVFEKEHNPDAALWSAKLRRLGALLTNGSRPQNILVGDLYDGSWLPEVANALRRIAREPQDSQLWLKVRPLLDDLYPQLEALSVVRPSAKDDWPDSDVAWAEEAIASDSTREFVRIATTEDAYTKVSGQCPRVCRVEDLVDGSLRDSIQSDWSPRLDAGEQVSLLRPLLQHAQFVDLVVPYAGGLNNDDTPFAEAVLRAFRDSGMGIGHRSAALHVQVASKLTPQQSGFELTAANTLAQVSTALRSLCTPQFTVMVAVWARLLDRYIIAGKGLHPKIGQTDDRRAIWAVHMGHTASPEDRNRPAGSPPRTEWHMKSRSLVAQIFDHYCVALHKPRVYARGEVN